MLDKPKRLTALALLHMPEKMSGRLWAVVRKLPQPIQQGIDKGFKRLNTHLNLEDFLDVNIERSNEKNWLGEDIVTIIVGTGDKTQKFVVHKNTLCSKVDFFEKMFTHGFREARLQAATLPEDHPSTFQSFLDWLYTDKITFVLLKAGQQYDIQLFSLLDLYFFAFKYCINALSDDAMTYIQEMCRQLPAMPYAEMIRLTYERTTPGAKLRLLLSRIYALEFLYQGVSSHPSTPSSLEWTSETTFELGSGYPELFRDLLVHMRQDRYLQRPHMMEYCAYHVHGENQECPWVVGKKEVPVLREGTTTAGEAREFGLTDLDSEEITQG